MSLKEPIHLKFVMKMLGDYSLLWKKYYKYATKLLIALIVLETIVTVNLVLP